MNVQEAQREDVPAWLSLAAEVEHLFGPMVNEPSFLGAFERNIERGSAFCIRESDGPPGAPLLGGILFSPTPPTYRIGWLSVTRNSRRRGLGTALVAHVMGIVKVSGEVTTTTFGPDVRGGEPARQFYLAAGFTPAEMARNGPDGGSRQVFRYVINAVDA